MSETCVVHLVRAVNGIEPFRRFIDSYRENPAGIAHDLILIFKGFDADGIPENYVEAAEGLSYTTLHVADERFDIGAYFSAVRALDHRHLFFLNSFSVILSENWLAKIHKHAGRGLVGATGSHESLYTTYVRRWKQILPRRFYRGVLAVESLREALDLRRSFPPFPNYHVRSNAFLIERDLMLRLKIGQLAEKADGYRFESGRAGMTRQVLAMGSRPVVVGRDGLAYEKEEWYESFTFRSGEQQNLLVADNQTRHFEKADIATRDHLTIAAWGKR